MAIQIYSEKSNLWRDSYNPLRGMGMPRLVALLEAGERGQFADLQWFITTWSGRTRWCLP